MPLGAPWRPSRRETASSPPHALNVPTGGVGAGAQAGTSIGQQIAQMQFKPMNNVSDVLSKVLTAGLKVGAFPSRFVGFQDEFVKQIA